MISSVARWNLSLDEATKIANQVAPILRDMGATEIRCGIIQSGSHAGRTISVITYPNGEVYGKALDAQQKNNDFRRIMGSVQDKMIDRQTVIAEDIK